MAAVGLSDSVTVTPAQALTVQTVPASDFPMQKNTAYRAAIAMAERYGREANVCVTIEKRIPLCAGWAAPRRMPPRSLLPWRSCGELIAPTPRSTTLRAGIGADVPFFLHASPALYVGGGDVLATEYPALPATPGVLVKPHETSVSTVEAYRRFDESPVPADKPDAIASALTLRRRRGGIRARPQQSGCHIRADGAADPGMVLDWLREQDGTVAVDVCGSGACSFAICDTAASSRKACGTLPSKTAGGPARRSYSQHGSNRRAKEIKISLARDENLCYYSRANGLWLSLVEHCVRDAGVAGSNPVNPTRASEGTASCGPFF